MASPHLILVGLPGAGKSTVGRLLATRLERWFSDFDIEIERSIGLSVSEIFAQQGEAAFRAAEVLVSQRLALDPRGPGVLAPGGGWIANVDAVAHLRATSRIIYLRVSPDAAVGRMGRGVVTRPLFKNETPIVVMQRLLDQRGALYEGAADLIVDTDGAESMDVVARVMASVAAYGT